MSPGLPLPRTVVLDTSEIQADWMFRGLAMRVLRFMSWHDYLKVVVPPVVVEELVANHARASRATDQKVSALNRERSRAGLPAFVSSGETVEYREFLESFLDGVVSGWEVPGWPQVAHRDLVGHSLSSLAPFDEKGRGYRDALIWATALECADAGHEVV